MKAAFRRRASQGRTQDDLAALLDVNKALISRRLNGTANLTLKSLAAMAAALQCELKIIFQPYEELEGHNHGYEPPPTVQKTVIAGKSSNSLSGVAAKTWTAETHAG